MMISNRGKKNRPGGFTLVELLVVMAIIGVLMALVMPAIMAIRQAAWRAACTNNERNIAMAILTYHTSKQSLPYWSRAKPKAKYSWCAQILEQLGEGKLGQLYDDDNLNSTVQLPILKCRAGDARPSGMSYVVNCGKSDKNGIAGKNNPDPGVAGAGLFFRYDDANPANNYKSSLALVGAKDGASNTILLSETLNKHNKITQNWHSSDDDVRKVGILWDNGKVSQTNPKDYGKDNSLFFDSNHSNTDQVAFADGSVKSVNKRINYNTYACLMAPDDAPSDKAYTLVWKVDANYE